MRPRLAKVAVAVAVGAAVAAATAACVVGCARFGSGVDDDVRDAGTSPLPDGSGDASIASGDSSIFAGSCMPPSDAKAFFCRTFDEPGLSRPYGFDTLEHPEQGTVALVDAPARTGKGLRITLGEGASERAFMLVKDLGDVASRYDLAFDLYVTSSSLSYGAVGALRFLGNSYAAFPGIAAYDSSRFLSKLAPSADEATVKIGEWHHISVQATMTGGFLSSSIFVDGNLVGREEGASAAPAATSVSLALGCFFTGDEPGAMDVIVDDLVVVVR